MHVNSYASVIYIPVTFSSGTTKSGSNDEAAAAAFFVRSCKSHFLFVSHCPFRNSYPPISLEFDAAIAQEIKNEKER